MPPKLYLFIFVVFGGGSALKIIIVLLLLIFVFCLGGAPSADWPRPTQFSTHNHAWLKRMLK